LWRADAPTPGVSRLSQDGPLPVKRIAKTE
jgi:hypothetical protein